MDEPAGSAGEMVDLRADCASCFGLCCVALPFAASTDFPVDKAAGEPCRNLQDDFRCGIHDHLRERGWKGCTVFDCFGAGQQLSQVTFGGVSWREEPGTARQMFSVFPVLRQVHEILAHLREGATLVEALPMVGDGGQVGALRQEVSTLRAEVEALPWATAGDLSSLDLDALRSTVAPLLRRVSAAVRQEAQREGAQRGRGAGPTARARGDRRLRPGADLMGVDLRRADLRAADLRGALLIAADLRRADLTATDLLGADLRDADARGADLRGALFLTQAQVNAVRGDASTRIAPARTRPSHWR